MTAFHESEFATRRTKVDVLLQEQGWNVRDPRSVRVEIDTKQSDFRKRDYRTVAETLKNEEESAYADYLLLDANGDPLAVVEAKRSSKDPVLGQRQAEGYAEDIKQQIGKDVFIFLTNGYEIWFWNRGFGNPRSVKGFHNREALKRIQYQNLRARPLQETPLRKDIVDRPYQIEAVKRVLEGIENGKRKFLLVQATGTGKTRVAMALIDVLLQSNRAQKILFLADRKALRDQAFNEGFKVFFPDEHKSKVITYKLDKNARLFASTLQTFMECYRSFSPGDFDVIITDECHRSIYNKWKDAITYFDAIQIGLTATPADLIERDTFRFFECESKTPTVLYDFPTAVKEGYLVDFVPYGTQTHFQIEGIRPSDIPGSVKNRLAEEGIQEGELVFDGTDIERKVAVIGTNEAIVKEFWEECLKDQTGTLPAKTIFFALSKKHAKRIWEAFEKLYPQYKGRLARIIVSEDSRAQETLKEFKTESFPRVAISVDMLDTGVNVPEVCNLVFAKPVFSKIKFWQMIGRGTRHDSVCTHKEWLPGGKKEYFKIFDCWKVFEWFDVHPAGKEPEPSEALPAKIFLLRLQKLDLFLKQGNQERADRAKEQILADIRSLPRSSISVNEKSREIEQALSPRLWETVGLEPLTFLKEKMAPLMKYQENVELNRASFVLKLERLGIAILKHDKKEIERLKEEIAEAANALPPTIQAVREKASLIRKVTSRPFWNSITYDDTLLLLRELAPLMKYKRTEPRNPIILDMDDVIQQRSLIEFGPDEHPQEEYVDIYREKVEQKIHTLADSHPTILKIKDDKALTERDLRLLEKTLHGSELSITEDVLQKVYRQHNGDLVDFVRHILKLAELPDPKQRIVEAFKTFVVEKNYLNADQVNFLRALQSVFLAKHHVEYKNFFDPPLTNIGNAPIPLFTRQDLGEILELCNGLEEELFPSK
ncbi:MAG: DEAD/DEAH box helicase family protein [Candidatus Aenigmarchaeota archaeon]|nr:DEAD/DEAH box helicase family protein [Candidatus Aenigmarchaeota archaeon]